MSTITPAAQALLNLFTPDVPDTIAKCKTKYTNARAILSLMNLSLVNDQALTEASIVALVPLIESIPGGDGSALVGQMEALHSIEMTQHDLMASLREYTNRVDNWEVNAASGQPNLPPFWALPADVQAFMLTLPIAA